MRSGRRLDRLLLSLLALVVTTACSREEPVLDGRSTVRTAPVVAPGLQVPPPSVAPTELPDPEAPANWVVWVHDREPPDLQVDDPQNGTDLAGWIQQGLLEGLFGVDSNLAYYPELLAGQPVVTKADNGSVTIDYTLRSGLTWSDGRPLTAEDVAFTHKVLVEGCPTEADGSLTDGADDGCDYVMGSRIGYDLITKFEVTSPTTFRISFAAFFAGWRNLFPAVFAAHAFGADAFSVDQNLRRWASDAGPLPSSGPLLFTEWAPGDHIDLARNDRYHGSVSPEAQNKGPMAVEGVRILFVGNLATRLALLQDGTAQLVMGPLDPAFGALSADPSFTVASRPGGTFEHLGLNLLNVHLAKPPVREAIAYALDKAEIVAQVYAPLLKESVPAAGLGNAYWMPMEPGYTDHQERYGANDVAGAAAALEGAGYVKDADGVYSHPTDGRLTLRIGTTPGNSLRQQQMDLIKAQLGRAGIEVVTGDFTGGLFYDQGPFSPGALAASASGGTDGDPKLWDMAVWSWATGPWPGGVSGIFRARSDANPYGFSNATFEADAAACDTTVDDTQRATCYNDIDAYVTTLDKGTDGLFVLPLTQKPRYYGYVNRVLASAGVAPDLVQGGPLVNAGDLRTVG